MMYIECYYETLVCIVYTRLQPAHLRNVCISMLLLWDLEAGWKDIDSIHGRLCKTMLRTLRSAANQIGELTFIIWSFNSAFVSRVRCLSYTAL